MKKTLIFSALLLLFGSSFSQVNEADSFEEHQAMFSEINPADISTGILYDRVLPFSGIEKYNGKNKDAICKKAYWKQMYYELQNASYVKDTVNMPNLDFILGTKRQFTNGKLIPIYLLNYEYEKIKENALDNELLLLRNGKLIDNPVKNESPFEKKRVFVATPYKAHTYYGNDFSFILNGNYLFTNTDEKLVKFFADFDDGFDMIEIAQGKILPVSYAETGEKTITIKAITEKNDTLFTKFAFEVKAKSIPNYTMHRFQTTEYIGNRKWFCTCNNTYYETYAGAVSHCRIGCTIIEEKIAKKSGDLYHFKSSATPNKTDKAFLIVEGFDMEDNKYAEELYERYNKQHLAETVLANNFDIYILNYDVPTDDIKNNAVLVENVIDYINENKGNKTELVIAGASMGGLTTRYALTKMEQSGKNTQTRLWISTDSPQKGANIPLGLQFWIEQFADDHVLIPEEIVNQLRTPGAKQMLLYHFENSRNGTAHPDNEFNTFFNDINNKGYPLTCRNIAVTNGASDGTGQGYYPSNKLITAHWRFLWQTKTRYIDAWAVPDNYDEHIFRKIKKKNNRIKILSEYFVNNTQPLDNSPGGNYNTMQKIKDAVPGSVNATVEVIQKKHAFIPAISALALNGVDYDYSFRYDDNILNKTPFDEVYFPNQPDNYNINQPHVWVSHETAENILKELYPDIINLPNADWQQGEMQAVNSIHITNGFHASASDELHLHTGNYINNLINEEWTEDDYKNKADKNKNTTSNINMPESENITIYPNPNKGIFTININNELSTFNFINFQLNITDLTGKIVYLKNETGNNIKINISDKPNGIYVLKIIYDNKIISRKIIKQ